jgi:hypothetical protein
MSFRKHHLLILAGLGFLLLSGLYLAWPSANAKAQCGSQASSCKNCHEVQGNDSVNSDGTGWHQSHAFGDFCYICHAGNNQSMDKATAHTGMVAPLSDVKAACQSCHPNDLMARAQVYATALGVQVGEGGGASGAAPTAAAGSTMTQTVTTSGGGAATTGGQTASGAGGGMGLVTGSGEVVDYNQQYAETVLGQRTFNWGNVILVVLILLVAVGGGAFVVYNERKRRGLRMLPPKSISAGAKEAELPNLEAYSPEVVALLPKIAQLDPLSLHDLKRLLDDPDNASQLLHSLSRLDPELVRRVRSLDQGTRALLLGMSGD